ncbi:MAG: FimV/HubP family polar landmark protein [Burkholderiaceae bacterium]
MGWSVPAPDHCQTPASLIGGEHRAGPNYLRRGGVNRAVMLARGIVLLAAMGMGCAHAAGLGKLTVLSGLGQPLRAEIELTSVGKDEAPTLVARLAPADAYSKSNIEYSSALTNLRFAVAQRADGTQFLSITSIGPVSEPFLDMLIQLDWASGRLVREYTVLLDPPELKTAQTTPVTPIAPLASSPGTSPSRRGQTSSVQPSIGVPSPSRGGSTGATGGAGGTYEVKRGDTAAKIARENRPDGVSLEQVLVALLRGNPSAFEGNNVNRLRTGAVMQLPDAASVRAVDSSEAQRLVSAQAADFSAYRGRVGANAATAPIEEKPTTQAASGKLTAKVDEKQAAGADTSDQLKLSKPAPKGGGGASAATAKSTGPSAEDLAAKERALKEADERVKLLEKNVSDLQKLLDLKNQNLAQLQKQLDAAQAKAAEAKTAQGKAAQTVTPVAPPPVVNPPVVTAPVVSTPPPPPPPVPVTPPVVTADKTTPDTKVQAPVAPEVKPTPAPETPPPAAQSPTPPAVTPAPTPVVKKPAPPPPAETSWLDDVMDNLWAIVGGVVVLLLLGAYGVYHQRRKKKFSKFEDSILTGASGLRANSVFGTTGGQSVDTSNSAFNSNFVPMSPALPA